jgi:DNA repair protein RecO (recombination protein O)
MIESSSGLILRTRPLTETSLIVHWLTPKAGRVATVAKGARRAKSPFAGKLDLFYAADFSFVRGRRSDLHTLREVSLRATRSEIRQDMQRLRQAGYAANFIEQVTETDTPLPGIYELTGSFLDCLCRQPPVAQLVFAFELKLLHELGLQPDWTQTGLSAGTKKIAAVLAQNDWAAGLRLKLTGLQSTELRQFLHGFLIFHLGRLPKGRAAALTE